MNIKKCFQLKFGITFQLHSMGDKLYMETVRRVSNLLIVEQSRVHTNEDV